ncbi:MAG: hypothetical protein JNN04_01565, partial [Cyclobacteriaceae bacterium]|nr:hypothetical protein [Cyclobacteriaceae bacterium]
MKIVRVISILGLVLTFALNVHGQVDEIKDLSETASSGVQDTDNNSGSGSNFLSKVLLFLPHWQKYKLHPDNRQRYPSMVSLDMYAQAGYKDKAYMFWPRIRGNWGLFSTDFRANYLFEKDDTGGYKQLHTNDWQVLQLNITTSRLLTFRVGLG